MLLQLIWKFVVGDNYTNVCENKEKCLVMYDGVIDSKLYLLINYNGENREMIQMLLVPY